MGLKVQATGGTPGIDEAEFVRGLNTLVRPGGRGAVEFRALPSRKSVVVDPRGPDGDILRAARSLPQEGQIYFGINPCRADLKGAASKGDIVERSWLLVDIDPVRPKDTNSDEAEKAAAWGVVEALRLDLCDANWPNPVIVDSGNGYHVYYRVHLLNGEAEHKLVRDCLAALARLYDTDAAKVDRAVCDAPRIAKMPGTWARKGASSPRRPHRVARVVFDPGAVEAVSPEQLRQLADAAPRRRDDGPPEEKRRGLIAAAWSGQPGTAREKALRSVQQWADIVRSSRSVDDGGEGRNATLNRAAWTLARFVGAGVLAEEEVAGPLRDAARSVGCPGVEATLRSGLAAGRDNPAGKWMPADGPSPLQPVGKGGKPQAEGKPPPDWAVMADDEVLAAGPAGDVLAALGTEWDGEAGKVRTFHLRTMESLMAVQFPPVKWLIKDIMSEGLNLLIGAPKLGKSVLALNLALTIAGGGEALGVQVQAADVLYLSLEDKDRRVQWRAGKMLASMPEGVSTPARRRLTVATSWPRQDEGGLKLIGAWLKRVKEPGLVIIDVWNRFAPAHNDRGNAYRQDADQVSEVKQWCDAHGVAGLIVHHDRKAMGGKPEDDFVASISGTQGIAGSADGIMVLQRLRHEKEARLMVTGRDAKENKLAVEFDGESLVWKYLGHGDKVYTGKVQAAVIDCLKRRGEYGASIKEVANHIGKEYDTVRTVMSRMLSEKAIERRGNIYRWPFTGDPDTPPRAGGEGV